MVLSLSSVEECLEELRQQRMIIVMDDADREGEADLVMASQFATDQDIAFMLQHTSGIICAPMLPSRASVLDLPLMVKQNTEEFGTKFTITVDHKQTHTGISAKDRAITLQRLAALDAFPLEFNRPGHVFPLVYTPGGVLVRQGHTEASIDCLLLAELTPCAVISELMNVDGTVMQTEQVEVFAKEHGLKMIRVHDIKEYIMRYRIDAGKEWLFE